MLKLLVDFNFDHPNAIISKYILVQEWSFTNQSILVNSLSVYLNFWSTTSSSISDSEYSSELSVLESSFVIFKLVFDLGSFYTGHEWSAEVTVTVLAIICKYMTYQWGCLFWSLISKVIETTYSFSSSILKLFWGLEGEKLFLIKWLWCMCRFAIVNLGAIAGFDMMVDFDSKVSTVKLRANFDGQRSPEMTTCSIWASWE